MDKIAVGIGEGKIAADPQILISYALGSCVGVCLYDRGKKIAGMAHIVLPGKLSAVNRENPFKFADEGVRELLYRMERAGAARMRITAKIAGGAKMFETGSRQWEIGEQNVAAVKLALAEEGIRLVAEDTGNHYGRTILFFTGDGKLEVRTVRHETVVL